jgi:type I restriction enzyme S subunit
MGVGSLGKVSLFSYDGDKQFVTDSTLRIYRAKEAAKVLPEVLFLFLQSAIGQELIYRYVVGSTGIINIYDDDMAKIPIPVLDTATQKDIAAKVQESFSLRRQSKQLLEYAKQAVEMAIEQGEGVALTWLEDKV